MNTKSIDLVNILLIAVCLLFAFKIPFEMFFFMYAVLGPLHYLTEMRWLREKGFFVQKKNLNWVWLILAFTIFVSIKPTLKFLGADTSWFTFNYTGYVVLTFFLFAASIVLFKKTWKILLSFVAGLLFSFFIYNLFPKDGSMVIATLIPTTIHVYLFTGLFMLYGALRSKSKIGYWSVVALFIVPFIIIGVDINPIDYYPSERMIELIQTANFSQSLYRTAYIMGLAEEGGANYNPLLVYAVKLKIFFAFAYTYHYLNWFSKTSIIGWAKGINKKSALIIGGIWLLSISIYYYDYNLGFLALFFLSYLHVALEFPLNVVTIKEVFKFARPAQS